MRTPLGSDNPVYVEAAENMRRACESAEADGDGRSTTARQAGLMASLMSTAREGAACREQLRRRKDEKSRRPPAVRLDNDEDDGDNFVVELDRSTFTNETDYPVAADRSRSACDDDAATAAATANFAAEAGPRTFRRQQASSADLSRAWPEPGVSHCLKLPSTPLPRTRKYT